MSAASFSRRSVLAGGLGAIAAVPALAQAAGARPTARPVVATRAGRLAGAMEGGVFVFRGIPYGEPTGGAARFLPPRPKQGWDGIREATAFGARCPQRGGPGGPGSSRFSEDCLVANVWTASLEGEKPVMVWLHGGGWEVGGGDDPVSNGAWLARMQDVVLVSINHRLNVFGYLDLSGIGGEAYAHSANAGILDIALALQWVRDNAAAFGGDPDRVLIFGQSGGGRKTSTMMAMPAAAGLFQRCVVESGPALRMDERDVATDRAERLLHRLGIGPGELDRLATVPTARLTAAGIEVRNETGQFRPVVDGSSLPRHPFHPDAPLISAQVPMMIGTARDETALFLGNEPAYAAMSAAELLAQSARFFPEGEAAGAIATWRGMFPDFSNGKLFARLTTDRSYFLDATLQAERKAALGRAPAFLYTIDWQSTVGAFDHVTPHGTELPFVFGNLAAWPFLGAITPKAEMLRSTMSGAWASFARNGVPDHPGMPQWLPYEPSLRATMLFGEHVRLESDPFRAERSFMARFGSEQLGAYEPRPPGPWIRN